MTDVAANFSGVFQPGSKEEQLLQQIDGMRLPSHIAVIMDGNGRWAHERGLPRVEGHRAGIEAVKAVVEVSARLKISYLTLYAFSSENWKRPKDEVNTLWSLLRKYLQLERDTLKENEIQFSAIGRLQRLPRVVQQEIRKVTDETARNRGMHLIVALNYGGRQELVDAFNRLPRSSAAVTEKDIANHLYTAGIPDPDLLVRSSGEMRISNFLLWQLAYSEIYVSDVLWPDFRGGDLLQAIVEYQKRDRRYGGIKSSLYQSTL